MITLRLAADSGEHTWPICPDATWASMNLAQRETARAAAEAALLDDLGGLPIGGYSTDVEVI